MTLPPASLVCWDAASSAADSATLTEPALSSEHEAAESESSASESESCLAAMIWRSSFRSRGAATSRNMLMSMVTESSEHWQCWACMPTPIQERVAKFVDSAQLYPWLKPQW